MTLAVSSLRSHFFKHLTACNSAATFFSLRRRIHCLPPPFRFSYFPSTKAAQQKQSSRRNITAPSYSTLQLSNGTVITDDSLTSPYLSVRICCPKHVSVRQLYFLQYASAWLCVATLCSSVLLCSPLLIIMIFRG